MGTWSTAINGNDTFLDIYQNFFRLYNKGQNPTEISKQILDDFKELFNDQDDRNNSFFGLALAQWETKSLDPKILQQVTTIIESDNDLEFWKAEGGDEKTLKKRKKVLDKFLIQISNEREKPKRRVKEKFIFSEKELIQLVSPDNKKTFTVNEFYTNGVYDQTGSLLNWAPDKDKVLFNGGGHSIIYFSGQEQFLSARWLDSQKLEITHDKSIVFTKKEIQAYFCGDIVSITYIAR